MDKNLNNIEDGSTSLDIDNLLDTVEYKDRLGLLLECMKKIGLGETITIRGVDLVGLSYEFIYGSTNISAFNECIYQNKSLGTSKEIVEFLLSHQFNIIKRETHLTARGIHSEYIIIAKRTS